MLVAPAFDKTCKKLLKARALDIYQDIFYLECKNHLATAGATG